MEKFEYFLNWILKVSIIIIGLLNIRRITRFFFIVFAGTDDKMDSHEFDLMYRRIIALVFLAMGCYMVYKEGGREHEWHLYNEFYVLIVFGLLTVLLGLGVFEEILKAKYGHKEPDKEQH